MSTAPQGLYPHQVEGIGFLTRHGRAILADDMGLGKTRQAIVAMEQAAPTGAVLVICPASLKLNWATRVLFSCSSVRAGWLIFSALQD